MAKLIKRKKHDEDSDDDFNDEDETNLEEDWS